MLNSDGFVVLSCKAGMPFAQRVINKVNAGNFNGRPVVELGILKTGNFEDGEPKAKLDISIREKSVHLFQCYQIGLSTLCFDMMELLVTLDLLKRSGAKKITVYLPYPIFQRQEKKIRGREPLSARMFFDIIATAAGNKLERIVMADMHTDAAAGFANVPVDNISAWPLFALYIKQVLKLEPNEFVIVAPDAGGATRARTFAVALNATSAIIEKRRQEDGKTDLYNLIGSTKNKIAIMIDDMISTGGTLVDGQKLLLKEGAKKVYAFATHGLFTVRDGVPAEQRFYDAQIEVVTTDSIPEKAPGYFLSCNKWLKNVISLSHYFADALVCNETGNSLSNTMVGHEKNMLTNGANINDFLLQI